MLKKYFHIGFAADTPNGLVVPVIRDVDKKGVLQIAQEIVRAGEEGARRQARARGHEGGCFSISSLGGIGGTAFTPIVNAPEVAILGVSKSAMQPGLGRQAVRAAPDPAAVAELRPPRHRRRRRRALHRVPGAAARRHAPGAAVMRCVAWSLRCCWRRIRRVAAHADDRSAAVGLGRGWPPATENYGTRRRAAVRRRFRPATLELHPAAGRQRSKAAWR